MVLAAVHHHRHLHPILDRYADPGSNRLAMASQTDLEIRAGSTIPASLAVGGGMNSATDSNLIGKVGSSYSLPFDEDSHASQSHSNLPDCRAAERIHLEARETIVPRYNR